MLNKPPNPDVLSPTGSWACLDRHVYKSSFPLTGNRAILPALDDHFCTFAVGQYDYEDE
jgi:hypothetical protein